MISQYVFGNVFCQYIKEVMLSKILNLPANVDEKSRKIFNLENIDFSNSYFTLKCSHFIKCGKA